MWDRHSESGRAEQLPGKSNSQGAVEYPELRNIIYYMQLVYVYQGQTQFEFIGRLNITRAFLPPATTFICILLSQQKQNNLHYVLLY